MYLTEQLKRIRSGEALDSSTADNGEYAASAAADRRRPRRASMQPLEEVSENDVSLASGANSYDDSPHFPRDKSRLLSSPAKLANNPNSSKSSAGPGGGAPTAAAEPNVDFDFHVKIFINSGRCVLHTEPEGVKQQARTMGR